jgi:hypothetical protein
VFASAAIFSALASAIYDSGGWSDVATLGGALAAIGVVVWTIEQLLLRRRRQARAHAIAEAQQLAS